MISWLRSESENTLTSSLELRLKGVLEGSWNGETGYSDGAKLAKE